MNPNPPGPRTLLDRTIGDVRVVSEVAVAGHIEVPNDAVDVRVEPVRPAGWTRVTYRQPLRPVPFEPATDPRPYIY